MTSMTLSAQQPPLQRLGAFLNERRCAAATRRQHAALMRDPRMAAEHVAATTRAEAYGQDGCPYCH